MVLTTTVVWVSTDRLWLLIFIVEYNAESTLTPVPDRLPAEFLHDFDCEVLVINDASVRLSEWHSGYRLDRVSILVSMGFAANSNDLAFDTENIPQLLNGGAHSTELAIPTDYADEISRIHECRYAAKVMAAGPSVALHRHGLVHQRGVQPTNIGIDQHEVKMGFANNHRRALKAVPDSARVLDLRADPGGIASQLENNDLVGCLRGDR